MPRITENFEIENLISQGERAVAKSNFANINLQMGIGSALVNYISFAYGKAVNNTRNPLWQFFYDNKGRVVKRFDFNPATGEIDTKETFAFEKIKLTENLVSSKVISIDNTITELYKYDINGRLSEYILESKKWWPAVKREVYEYDKFGRKAKKVSYGLINEPYLITHYLYDNESAKDRKVTYRYVTTANGELYLTILWTYDTNKEKQIGMYSFNLTPAEITALRKHNKDWELHSISKSLWEYDDAGNLSFFTRDILLNKDLKAVLGSTDKNQFDRMVTAKYSNRYEKLDGKTYLVKTTEWLTQMDEPLHAEKQYQYFDKNGKSLYPRDGK